MLKHVLRPKVCSRALGPKWAKLYLSDSFDAQVLEGCRRAREVKSGNPLSLEKQKSRSLVENSAKEIDLSYRQDTGNPPEVQPSLDWQSTCHLHMVC